MDAFGKIGRQFLDALLDELGGLECVRARRERDRDAGAGMAVHARDGAIIIGAEFNPRDIPKANRRAAGIGLEDDIAELLGRLKLAL